MRLVVLTVAFTLVLPGVLFAQESSACGREPGRTLRGQVVDSAGQPADSAVVQVVVRRSQGDYGGGRCEVEVAPNGNFEVAGVPADSVLMVMVLDFGTRRGAGALLEPSPADTTLTFTVGRGYPSIRDWTALEDRPPFLDDADDLTGCYWMGWPILGEESRFFVVGDSAAALGRSPEDGGRPLGLQLEGDSLHIGIFAHPNWGLEKFVLDVSEPIDWTAIPTHFIRDTDNIRFPQDVRSFVTRVPCADVS